MFLTLGVLPLVAILAAPCVLTAASLRRPHPAWVATAVVVALLAATAPLGVSVLSGQTLRLSLPWFPEFGVRYALTLDGLALVFVLLILGAGALIFAYSAAYMPREPELGRFYAYMLLFAGAMLGVVLSDDLVLLYIFWELTSLASFFLIGYRHDDPAARSGATQALIVTVAGGLAMLVGFVLLAQAGGSWQISALISKAAAIRADGRYPAILGLVLLGAFTKSAQVPFQFWLPSAMVAPTPVSTYLHSATMVWAGVYLLGRLLPLLGGTALWTGVITPVGLVTLLVGSGLALVQTDLKALLAYSTVGALGQAVALAGWGTPVAMAAMAIHVLNHAAYKGTLFLVSGAVEHETGTRQLDRLGGLRRAMPITAGVAGTAALSLASLPPFGGFLSKEASVDAFWSGSAIGAIAVVVSGGLALAYGARFMRIFLSPLPVPKTARARVRQRVATDAHRSSHAAPHEPPWLLWAPGAVLALGALVFGLFPGWIERLAQVTARALAGGEGGFGLWHGLDARVLGVLAATVAVGAAGIRLQDPAGRAAQAISWLSAGRAYDVSYDGALASAKTVTGAYMTGHLRDYLVYIMVTAIGLLAYGFLRTGVKVPLSLAGLGPGEAGTVIIAIAAAVAAVRVPMLIGSILALGVVGYSVSLIYLFVSAPDIAITQAVIETVSLVLFVVALTALGRTNGAHPDRHGITDAVVALGAGAATTAVCLMVADISPLPRIADAFFTNALKAGGANVVNLVIIDFRGWDTVGEITVLGIAALGIIALAPWRMAIERLPAAAPHERPMTTLILRTISLVAAPLIVLFAVRLWWTGHYGPGGGFVGGLMNAAALSLLALSAGAGRLAGRWDLLMALGLLLAYGSALVPLAVGSPLLQHTVVYLGPLKLASSLIFDLGVMLLVTGTVMSAIRSLVEAS